MAILFSQDFPLIETAFQFRFRLVTEAMSVQIISTHDGVMALFVSAPGDFIHFRLRAEENYETILRHRPSTPSVEKLQSLKHHTLLQLGQYADVSGFDEMDDCDLCRFIHEKWVEISKGFARDLHMKSIYDPDFDDITVSNHTLTETTDDADTFIAREKMFSNEEEEKLIDFDLYLHDNDIDPYWDAIKDYITDVSDFAEVQEVAVRTSRTETNPRFIVKIAKGASTGKSLKSEIYHYVKRIVGDDNHIEPDYIYLSNGVRPIKADDNIGESLTNVYVMMRLRGGAPSSVLKSALKDKAQKKTVIAKCAKDITDEVVGYKIPHECHLLKQAIDYVKKVEEVKTKDLEQVFQQAVDALELDDAIEIQSFFDRGNKKTRDTEHKIEELIKKALKKMMADLDSHVEIVKKSQQSIIASYISLYAVFAKPDGDKYDNTALKRMLTTHIALLKRNKQSNDVDVLTDMFAKASV